MPPGPSRHALVDALVDEDDAHARSVCSSIVGLDLARNPRATRGAEEASWCFQACDGVALVFVDTALPSDGAFDVIERAFRLQASPVVIAMGSASDSSAEVFELAKAGVHAYLPRPLTAEQIDRCLGGESSGLAPIRSLLRPLVGRFGLKDIQKYVREVLVREALLRTGGSRRSAARVLGVTRPAVQKFLRETEIET